MTIAVAITRSSDVETQAKNLELPEEWANTGRITTPSHACSAIEAFTGPRRLCAVASIE
jgi:hypothetical protein